MNCCTFNNIQANMYKKHGNDEKSQKRPETTYLRRRVIKIKPLIQEQGCQSPLISNLSLHPQVISNKDMQKSSLEQQIHKQTVSNQKQKTNRIYNVANKKIKSFENWGTSTISRASINNLGSRKEDIGLEDVLLRPKSSHNKKFIPRAQIFKTNNDVLNYQNRPGSSKSSRLITKKQAIEKDPINAQNQDWEPFIKVNNIVNSRQKNNETSRHRTSNSLDPSQHIEIVPTKLDPDFYMLFAK